MAVAERILHLRPENDTRPDRALVYEAQRGHEEAATTLIRRYYPRIYSFVSHLTYGRSNTEDLTQEVFARALKALGRFNGEYQFEHWLLRIAKNLCIDEARRNVRQPEPTDPGELPELEGIPAPTMCGRRCPGTWLHRSCSAPSPRSPPASGPSSSCGRWRGCRTQTSHRSSAPTPGASRRRCAGHGRAFAWRSRLQSPQRRPSPPAGGS